MNRPGKSPCPSRSKHRERNRFHYFRPVKAVSENDSGFARDVAKNPEVVKEIIAYANKVSADLSIIPESNLFPVLCQVIICSVKTGYEIARKDKKL